MHQVMLDHLDQFLKHHSQHNFFYWHFINSYNHDNFYSVKRYDEDYYKFFKRHYEAGLSHPSYEVDHALQGLNRERNDMPQAKLLENSGGFCHVRAQLSKI